MYSNGSIIQSTILVELEGIYKLLCKIDNFEVKVFYLNPIFYMEYWVHDSIYVEVDIVEF